MDVRILIGIAVLLPFVLSGICLAIRKHNQRAPIIWINFIALTVVSLLLLLTQKLPFTYTPQAVGWNIAIIALDYLILVYFFYVGIRYRDPLVGILAIAQIVPLILFDTILHPVSEHPGSVTPALFIDHLSLVMCLIICIIGSLICIYGIRYMRDHEEHLGILAPEATRQPRFFLWMILFLGAMNGLVFANDIYWLYFFWEITTLSCYELIRHDLTKQAQLNAQRALWMCSLGSTAFVFAMVWIFAWTDLDTLSMQAILKEAATGPAAVIPLLLPLALIAFCGFTKAAQSPWQSWLLGAMIAPTPVSALLHSSTMVKAGVYLVMRIAPAFSGTALSIAVAVFGAFVFLVTSILAISQTEGKRVLAYSTIGNLGIIIFCAGVGTPLAWAAGIMLIIFHAISKGLLFLCAGVIEHDIWSRDIEDMEGLVAKYPLITGITIVGMLSMLIAPFGVLISKWAGIEAVSALGSGWAVLMLAFLALGSGATTIFWTKWMGRLLYQLPGGKREEKFIGLYFVPLILFIAGAVVFSILIAPFCSGLVFPAFTTSGSPFFTPEGSALFATTLWNLMSGIGWFAAWPIFVLIALALAIPRVGVKIRTEQIRPAYMCGEHAEYDVSEFTSLADERTELKTGGFYLERALGEQSLNWRFVNPTAIIILIVLFIICI